jgi:hypothetical protein
VPAGLGVVAQSLLEQQIRFFGSHEDYEKVDAETV